MAVSTVMVTGLPGDMAEREFRNCFTFAEGFTGECRVKPGFPAAVGWAKFDSPELAQSATRHLQAATLDESQAQPLQVQIAKQDLRGGRKRPREEWAGGGLAIAPPPRPPPAGRGGTAAGRGAVVVAPSHHVVAPVIPPAVPRAVPSQRVLIPPVPVVAPTPAPGGSVVPPHGTTHGDTMFLGNILASAEDEVASVAGGLAGFKCMKWKGGEKPQCWVQFHDPASCQAAVASLRGTALPSQPDVALIADFAKTSLKVGGYIPEAAAAAMQYAQQQQAEAAAQYVPPAGRQYRVAPRQDAAPAGGRDGGDRNAPCDTIFIGGIPGEIQQDEIEAQVSVFPGFVKSRCTGFGTPKPMVFVMFGSVDEAADAVRDMPWHLGNAVAGAQSVKVQFARTSLGDTRKW